MLIHAISHAEATTPSGIIPLVMSRSPRRSSAFQRATAAPPAIATTLACLALAATLTTSLAGCGAGSGRTGTLVGAGSTLVAPLVSHWQPRYHALTGVSLTYGSIGSGGGITQITARTVDFGASDAPLTAGAAKAANHVLEIPWALTATVVAYNLPGVPAHLKLTGPVLAGIFDGTIKRWSSPPIAALNPGLHLPTVKITPIYRSDASGDTYAVSSYLSHVSPTWKSHIGAATQVSFPVGVGASGNAGVGAAISGVHGSIGYLAIAYAVENSFDYALLRNRAGNYPQPGLSSIEAAAGAAPPARPGQGLSIVDPPASARRAYPLSTFTYALVPERAPHAPTLKPFLRWAITDGQRFGPKLHFAPLPAAVAAADRAAIARIKR